MALYCPDCGAEIPAENVNIQKTLALCDQCNHVFDFGTDSGTDQKSKRHKRKRPAKLRQRIEGDRLELGYRRVFDPETFGTAIGCSVVALIFAIIYVIAALNDPTAPKAILAIPGVLIATLVYPLICLLINVTRIVTDPKTLAIQIGPLPFPNTEPKRLDLDEIVRVFCEETGYSQKNQSDTHYYQVNAELIDGSRVPLLRSLPQEYAFYITRTLEVYLEDPENFAVPLSDDQLFDDSDQAEEAIPLAYLFDDDEAALQRSD